MKEHEGQAQRKSSLNAGPSLHAGRCPEHVHMGRKETWSLHLRMQFCWETDVLCDSAPLRSQPGGGGAEGPASLKEPLQRVGGGCHREDSEGKTLRGQQAAAAEAGWDGVRQAPEAGGGSIRGTGRLSLRAKGHTLRNFKV